MKRVVMLFLGLVMITSNGLSQQPGARGSVFHSGFVAVANDYATVYWNPAGMAQGKYVTIGGMVHRLGLNRELGFLSVIYPIGQSNRLALSWSGFATRGLEARQENSQFPDYYFSNAEQRIWLSASQRINPYLALGTNVKYFFNKLDDMTATGYGIDLGLLYLIDNKFRVGLIGYDLKSQLQWSTGLKEYLNRRGSLAGCYSNKNVTSALGIEIDDKYHWWIAAGIEYQVAEKFSTRMGILNKKLILGLGFDFRLKETITMLNYAVMSSQVTNELSHLAEICFAFNPIEMQRHRKSVEETDQSERMVMIRATNVVIREGPGMEYKKIGLAQTGQMFAFLSEKNGWYRILYTNRIGWVSKDFAKIVQY